MLWCVGWSNSLSRPIDNFLAEPVSREISRIRHLVDSLQRLELILQLGKITENRVAQRALYDISSYLVELTSPSTLTTLSLQCHASIDGPPTPRGLLKQTKDLGRSISASLTSYHRLEEVSLAVRFRVSFDEYNSMGGLISKSFCGVGTATYNCHLYNSDTLAPGSRHPSVKKAFLVICLIVCVGEMHI